MIHLVIPLFLFCFYLKCSVIVSLLGETDVSPKFQSGQVGIQNKNPYLIRGNAVLRKLGQAFFEKLSGDAVFPEFFRHCQMMQVPSSSIVAAFDGPDDAAIMQRDETQFRVPFQENRQIFI
jgi:hypothetical protein